MKGEFMASKQKKLGLTRQVGRVGKQDGHIAKGAAIATGSRGSIANQDKSQLERVHREDRARDDLRKAFAGDENRGPAGKQKEHHLKATHLSDRNPGRPSRRLPR